MVGSEPWRAVLKERGWVDMYQPSAEFAKFLDGEQTRVDGILRDLGIAK